MESIAGLKKQSPVSTASCVLILCFIMIFTASIFASPDKELQLNTKIVSASIYSNEAQITRSGEVDIQAGTFQIICDDLPERFVESSLQVRGSGSAEARIIGIDLRRMEKSEISSPRFTELKEKLEKLGGRHTELQIKREALKNRKTLMSSISEFSLDKSREQLSRESFSVQDWKVLLGFFEEENVETEGRIDAVTKELGKLEKEMKWIRSELAAMQVEDRSGKSVVIDCEVTSPGKLTIDISYLVPGAAWYPEYTIRYLEREREIELAYSAKIRQATGEDWEKTSVLLSTAKPHVGAAPPKLRPRYVSALGGRIAGRVTESRTGKPLQYANVVVAGTKMGSMTLADGSYSIVGVPTGSYSVKGIMMGYVPEERRGVKVGPGPPAVVNFRLHETLVGKTHEITVEAETSPVEFAQSAVSPGARGDELRVRGGRSGEVRMEMPPPAVPYMEADVTSSEFAVNLQIRKAIDLETGAEPKRCLVIRERLPGTFSLYAVPRLSEYVYVEGKFKNKMEVPLLEGLSEVYIETIPEGGTNSVSNFVGKERIEPVASGQDFTVHLGIDQDIKIEHELKVKEYLTKSGKKSKKIRYHYLITIESFKKAAAGVRIVDRIPVSSMKEVKIDDVDIRPQPYKMEEDGMCTWELSIEPGEKKEISIEYTVVFPGDWPEQYLNLRE